MCRGLLLPLSTESTPSGHPESLAGVPRNLGRAVGPVFLFYPGTCNEGELGRMLSALQVSSPVAESLFSQSNVAVDEFFPPASGMISTSW